MADRLFSVRTGRDRCQGQRNQAGAAAGRLSAKPDNLRKRFDTFMNERCKGKDATKLRFVIE